MMNIAKIIKLLALLSLFIIFGSSLPQNPQLPTFSLQVPFNLFSLKDKAAMLEIQPWEKETETNVVAVTIKVPSTHRELMIPGFPLFKVVLGNEQKGKDAFFTALMYPGKYFHVQLSGSICISSAKGIFKPVNTSQNQLCSKNALVLEFGKNLKNPTSFNDPPEFYQRDLVNFDPNSVLDLDTGELLLTGIDLPAVDLFGMGIVISASNLTLDLSDSFNPWDFQDPPDHLTSDQDIDKYWAEFDSLEDAYTDGNLSDPEWKGLYIQEAQIIPELLKINSKFEFHHIIIDNNGFTGNISIPILGAAGLEGFSVKDPKFKAVIVRNSFKEASLSVDLDIFNAQARGVLAFDHKGNWNARLGPMPDDDFVKICLPGEYKSSPFIQLNLEELRLGRDKENGPLVLTVDGKVGIQNLPTKKLPGFNVIECLNDTSNQNYEKYGLDFSGFKITFSSPGKISSPPGVGGWLALDSFKEVDFYGFTYTIKQIGIGTLQGFTDITQQGWFGIGGNFAFGDEFGIGVSINELKFKWGNPSGKGCTLNLSSGFCLEIPQIDIALHKKNVMDVKGSLEWKEDNTGEAFKGTVEASFPTLKFSVAAKLIIGNKESTKYWYFDAMTQFPSGIPIASNISIYGFMGGAGMNMQSKLLDENNDGIYEGIEWEISDKEEDSYVFKIGLVLGTSADNGYVINTDISLMIETAGPVITLEGKGWLLQNRHNRGKSNVYALIRYDGNQDLFLMQVTGQYEISEGDFTILKIGGGFEILASKPEWHVYLGWKGYKCSGTQIERAEQKLNVEIVKIFSANGYFMIGSLVPFPSKNPNNCQPGILLGGAFDYGGEIDAVVVTIYAEYWASGDLGISWSQAQTYVSFGLGGKAGFTLFGIDFGRGFDANLGGQYPNPAVLEAAVSFSIPLPFPFPDVRISFSFEWNDDPTENKNYDNPVPDFSHPLRSVELIFPQGNLQAQKKGAKLTCSGPKPPNTFDSKCPPCTTGMFGIPGDQNGKIDNDEMIILKNGKIIPPKQQEKITQLNPRFVLSFHRPITGKDISGNIYPADVQSNGGWQYAKAKQYIDKVAQFEVWYRFRDATLREIPIPEELFSCIDSAGNEIASTKSPCKTVGFWGSVWDSSASTAWDLEKLKINDQPGVGKNVSGNNDKLVDERRRQLFTWHVGALPKDGKSYIDGLFNKEFLEIKDPPKALRPNTFYQIKVSARYDWRWQLATDKKYKSGGSGGKLDTLDVAAENFYYCFQTGPAPKDLTPYVAWTNPSPDERNFYYGEDIFVLFNTAGMEAVYNDNEPILALFDNEGNRLAKGELMLENQLAQLTSKMLKNKEVVSRERYIIKLLDPYYLEPVYSFQFTTSRFKSFDELMDDTSTLIGGPNISSTHQLMSYSPLPVSISSTDFIVVCTPEPLPWESGKLTFSLLHKNTNKIIPLKRLTADNETMHVFVHKNDKTLPNGDYDLTFEYALKLPGLTVKNLKERIPSLEFYKNNDLKSYMDNKNKVLSFKKWSI